MKRDLNYPLIALDRSSKVPLHRQIASQIAEAIRSGPSDARLPSTRVLARLLAVSRNTVLAAYDILAARGLVCGMRGSGMRVTGARRGGILPSLQHVIRASGYPARVLPLADGDGNPLYIRF